MTAPSILVGIVTRNRSDILPKAIASALAQTVPNLRVAVIDDGSSDATSELSKQFPTVQWTRWSANRGYMEARNHWMTSAGEDYFVSLDDDAWFLEGDEVAIALDLLERERDVAAVAFDILSPDRPDVAPREPARPAAIFIGCGHVLRLSAVRAVGFYEETPGSYGGEEKDLCLRLLDAGHRVVKLPGVHVWHDKTNVARELGAQYRSGVCNDLVMTFRRTPAALVPAAFLAKCFQHWRFASKRGWLRPCLDGFRMFFKTLPSTWRSRRPVRAATLREFMRLART